jgi:Cu/Ag efflux protein CusF
MTRSVLLFNTLIAAAGFALASSNASAQAQMQMPMPMPDHGPHDTMSTPSQGDANALSEGEIKKIDKETGKLTVQHGPLANVNMPGMTMAFKAKDPAMLDQVKVGDKIRFRVERVNGAYAITKLESAK